MIESGLRWLGILLVVDLLAAFGLVALVGIVGRSGRNRIAFRALFGALIYLFLCSAFIYGGLWLALRAM